MAKFSPHVGLFEELSEGKHSSVLGEKFLLPPFTVLNAREGWWQDRKRAWLELGIKSELGRGEGITWGDSPQVTEKGLNFYRNQDKPDALLFSTKSQNRLNEIMSGSEEGMIGTSIFDPILCELAYRWFCPPNGIVLDPFAGGSVRGIVASKLGHQYIGIDLSAPQCAANRIQATSICTGTNPTPTWHVGDSRDVEKMIKQSVDFVFTCPPYADLEVYSDDPKDLSNLSYEDFYVAYAQIIKGACNRLKPNRFAAIVVGDVRGKDGCYYGFPWHTVSAFEAAELKLYNEAILITAIGSLPVRITRQFEAGRKLGKTHQNIFIFVKGDPKKAADACKKD